MTKTRVYKAGRPLEGQWVLAWQTLNMPAPAFWYYKTRREAREVARRMKS